MEHNVHNPFEMMDEFEAIHGGHYPTIQDASIIL